ncbi:MAG: AAA family ATPase [Holophagales bacterium]|nr:AAA family ATPase [Holophagales bacterium]
MRITEVHVENFRGVQCATLHCGALTALVGRNGAGKSTFLHALDLFYRPNATVTSEDFFHRRTDAPIAIRVTFEDLHPDETEAFRAYVHGNVLSVTKRFQPTSQGSTAGGQYFAARRVYGRFSSARAQSARKKINEILRASEAPLGGGPDHGGPVH